MKGRITIDIEWPDDAIEAIEEVSKLKDIPVCCILEKLLVSYMSPFVEEHEDSKNEFTYEVKTEIIE